MDFSENQYRISASDQFSGHPAPKATSSIFRRHPRAPIIRWGFLTALATGKSFKEVYQNKAFKEVYRSEEPLTRFRQSPDLSIRGRPWGRALGKAPNGFRG